MFPIHLEFGRISHAFSPEAFITKDLLASFGKTPVFEGAGSTWEALPFNAWEQKSPARMAEELSSLAITDASHDRPD